ECHQPKLYHPSTLVMSTATSATPSLRYQSHSPEKRQRVPSAYNRFINMSFSICREEIQRIKANNPHISHKQAFSTAGKNVSFFLLFLWKDAKNVSNTNIV
ncbi:hypothetical protein BHE74_00047022, partial [Ensete ventricosum]